MGSTADEAMAKDASREDGTVTRGVSTADETVVKGVYGGRGRGQGRIYADEAVGKGASTAEEAQGRVQKLRPVMHALATQDRRSSPSLSLGQVAPVYQTLSKSTVSMLRRGTLLFSLGFVPHDPCNRCANDLSPGAEVHQDLGKMTRKEPQNFLPSHECRHGPRTNAARRPPFRLSHALPPIPRLETTQGLCHLTDDQAAGLAEDARVPRATTASARPTGGCYLSLAAPPDYEITSSFPVLAADAGEDDPGDGRRRFKWVPHDDNPYGARANATTSAGGATVSRGYRARSRECFGYYAPRRQWHRWRTRRDDNLLIPQVATLLDVPAVPNGGSEYGYADVLGGEAGLSLGPAAMARRDWPLGPRAGATVVLGLGFGERGDAAAAAALTTDAVLVADDGADDGSAGGEDGGGAARFRFEASPPALSLRAYLEGRRDGGPSPLEKRQQRQQTQQQQRQQRQRQRRASNNTSVNYRHGNVRGLVTDTTILDLVLRTFLRERLELEGTAPTDLAVAWGEQWSLVRVTDRAAEGSGGGASAEEAPPPARRRLRGPVAPPPGRPRRAGRRRLRGGGREVDRRRRRRLYSLPDPHLVFHLRVYARYPDPFSSAASFSPAAERTAARLASRFGGVLTQVLNQQRYELIDALRRRSGYSQECNPVGSPGGGAAEEVAAGANGRDYTEIHVGVVNRFDCDKLLPLYYYELTQLAAREAQFDAGRTGEAPDLVEEERLDQALLLLALDDGYDGRYVSVATPAAVEDPAGNAGPSWSTAMGSVAAVLVVMGIAGATYVRREQKKVRAERDRRRRIREARDAREKRRARRRTPKGGGGEKKGGETGEGTNDGDGTKRARRRRRDPARDRKAEGEGGSDTDAVEAAGNLPSPSIGRESSSEDDDTTERKDSTNDDDDSDSTDDDNDSNDNALEDANKEKDSDDNDNKEDEDDDKARRMKTRFQRVLSKRKSTSTWGTEDSELNRLFDRDESSSAKGVWPRCDADAALAEESGEDVDDEDDSKDGDKGEENEESDDSTDIKDNDESTNGNGSCNDAATDVEPRGARAGEGMAAPAAPRPTLGGAPLASAHKPSARDLLKAKVAENRKRRQEGAKVDGGGDPDSAERKDGSESAAESRKGAGDGSGGDAAPVGHASARDLLAAKVAKNRRRRQSRKPDAGAENASLGSNPLSRSSGRDHSKGGSNNGSPAETIENTSARKEGDKDVGCVGSQRHRWVSCAGAFGDACGSILAADSDCLSHNVADVGTLPYGVWSRMKALSGTVSLIMHICMPLCYKRLVAQWQTKCRTSPTLP